MQRSLLKNTLFIITLIVFGFSAFSVCLHTPWEHAAVRAGDAEALAAFATPCDEPHEHDHHADVHSCPCLCHVPIDLGHTSANAACHPPQALAQLAITPLLAGIFVRLDRPPRLS